MVKKNELNFHIAFNGDDPRHVWAAGVLNKLGRRKATIIANALWQNEFGDVLVSGVAPVAKTQNSQPSAMPETSETHLQSQTTEDVSKLADSINASLELFEDEDDE